MFMTGCTASIKMIPQYDNLTDYDYFVVTGPLEVGLEIVERPGRSNPSLNQAFRKRGFLAVAVKLRNTSKNLLTLPIEGWSLELHNGQVIPAVRVENVARVMTGSVFGRTTQSLILFYEDVRYRYLMVGLPDIIVLQPNEEKIGFAFFSVGDEVSVVDPVNLSMQFSRFNVISRAQFILDLQTNEIEARN